MVLLELNLFNYSIQNIYFGLKMEMHLAFCVQGVNNVLENLSSTSIIFEKKLKYTKSFSLRKMSGSHQIVQRCYVRDEYSFTFIN